MAVGALNRNERFCSAWREGEEEEEGVAASSCFAANVGEREKERGRERGPPTSSSSSSSRSATDEMKSQVSKQASAYLVISSYYFYASQLAC